MSFLDIASGIYATNYPVFLTDLQEIALKNTVSEKFMDLFDLKFRQYANRVSDEWFDVMVECGNAEVTYRQNHAEELAKEPVPFGEIAMAVFIDLYNSRP